MDREKHGSREVRLMRPLMSCSALLTDWGVTSACIFLTLYNVKNLGIKEGATERWGFSGLVKDEN